MPEQTRLAGKVAVVTGAARGLGRAEALALAEQGAAVVVNDLHGADETVKEIEAAGGAATSHAGDVGDTGVARELVELAVKEYGDLHVLVNNAGIIRDRMIFSMTDEEWDSVLSVHLRGHFGTLRAATAHWRERSKQAGGPVYARAISTASEASLLCSPGQPNYAAAKSGITALTVSTAMACAKYGVRANVICPRARTEMTKDTFGATHEGGGLDPLAVDHVAPMVAFLAGPEAEKITGQVFVVHGGKVGLVAAPPLEQRFDTAGTTWTVDELAEKVGGYFADRKRATFAATDVLSLT